MLPPLCQILFIRLETNHYVDNGLGAPDTSQAIKPSKPSQRLQGKPARFFLPARQSFKPYSCHLLTLGVSLELSLADFGRTLYFTSSCSSSFKNKEQRSLTKLFCCHAPRAEKPWVLWQRHCRYHTSLTGVLRGIMAQGLEPAEPFSIFKIPKLPILLMFL